MVNGVCVALALFLAIPSLAQGQSPRRETLIEWHYIGQQGLKKMQELKTIQTILAMPETDAFWKNTAERWGRQAAARYGKGEQADPKTSQAISDLIHDIAIYESKFELASGSHADWILAVRIPRERHDTWSTNLWELAAQSKLGTPKKSGSGWEIQGSEQKYNLRLSREKNWTVLNGGFASADSQKFFISALSDKEASGFVVKVRADLPKLGKIWQTQLLQHAPRLSLVATPRGEELRSEATLTYPEDLGIKPEKWEVPISSITDPLIGFTAIQGIKKHIQESPLLKKVQMQKIPNQLFLWSQPVSLFSIYFGADVGDPKAFIQSVPPLLTASNSPSFLQGQLLYDTNRHFLAWKGLPIAVPYLRAGEGKDAKFVTGGLFPLENPSTNPAPAELFAQLNQKNLVFYEWEITQERIPQFRVFSQLIGIAQNKPISVPESPGQKWLATAAPHLGNTITSITLENPKELKMVRRSHIGFNALELVSLVERLDPPPPLPKVGGAQPAAPTPPTAPASTPK